MFITGIDHVQLAMPAGEEAKARAFYAGLLGLAEREKPAALAGRGGVWFGNDSVDVHLGVEEGFRAARKAHPAFGVRDLGGLRRRLEDAGVAVRDDDQLPGLTRIFVDDPFGNRIELIDRS